MHIGQFQRGGGLLKCIQYSHRPHVRLQPSVLATETRSKSKNALARIHAYRRIHHTTHNPERRLRTTEAHKRAPPTGAFGRTGCWTGLRTRRSWPLGAPQPPPGEEGVGGGEGGGARGGGVHLRGGTGWCISMTRTWGGALKLFFEKAKKTKKRQSAWT
jgi:hypothetical protein